MASSKLEERLAEALRIVGQDANGRWPYPEPIREFRPLWCCEHRKRDHWTSEGESWCAMCVGDEERHEYRRERDFRIDFAYPEYKIAIECEGVTYAAAGR